MLKFNFEEQLKNTINNFAKSKGIEEQISFVVEIPPKNINADLPLNAAMIIAKKVRTNPRIIATELIEIISKEFANTIKSAEIAGAGFINLHFTDEFLQQELNKILSEQQEPQSGHIYQPFGHILVSRLSIIPWHFQLKQK